MASVVLRRIRLRPDELADPARVAAAFEEVQRNFEEALHRLSALVTEAALPPVGARLSWQQDDTGIYQKTPDLPKTGEWAETDGSKVHDRESPFYGLTLPNTADTIIRIK